MGIFLPAGMHCDPQCCSPSPSPSVPSPSPSPSPTTEPPRVCSACPDTDLPTTLTLSFDEYECTRDIFPSACPFELTTPCSTCDGADFTKTLRASHTVTLTHSEDGPCVLSGTVWFSECVTVCECVGSGRNRFYMQCLGNDVTLCMVNNLDTQCDWPPPGFGCNCFAGALQNGVPDSCDPFMHDFGVTVMYNCFGSVLCCMLCNFPVSE